MKLNRLLLIAAIGLFLVTGNWPFDFAQGQSRAKSRDWSLVTTCYAEPDLDTGLIGYWKFDEGAGATAADSSGNGYNGTLVTSETNPGASWIPEGKIGGALSFDGIDDYVTLGDINAYEFGPEDRFTISLWIKQTGGTTGLYGTIIGRMNNVGSRQDFTWRLETDINGFLTFTLGDEANYIRASRFYKVAFDTYYHIAINVGKQGENITFYVNGVLQSASIERTIGYLSKTPFPFGIGGENIYSGPVPFQGEIDDVRIYNRALIQEEITTLANGNTGSGQQTYTITSNAEQNGWISPQGSITADTGSSITFKVVPNSGYVIDDIIIDGVSQGSPSIIKPAYYYTINDINENHTINARFRFLPAFTGAEGSGAYTTGGRGGRVLHVTTLEDNGSDGSPIAGSLRWALVKETGPRIIVFDVGGVIELNKRISVKNGDYTLAGQTAPGGIAIIGDRFEFSEYHGHTNNFIIRHLRVRGVHNSPDSGEMLGGFRVHDANNFILDHLSVTGAADENLTLYSKSKDYTVQWSSVEESGLWGQGGANHPKGDHNMGFLIQGGGGTAHHNLIANHRIRLPRVGIIEDDQIFDFRNNVIYNWTESASNFLLKPGVSNPLSVYFNVIGNNYIRGPSKTGNRNDIGRYLITAPVDQEDPRRGNLYIPNFVDNSADPINLWYNSLDPNAGPESDWSVVRRDNYHYVNQAAASPFVTTETAEQAYNSVVNKVGAWPRDATTRRTVNEVRTRTGGMGLRGPYEYFPERRNGPSSELYDTDRDGMPNDWEIAHNLDPNNPEDRNNKVPVEVSQRHAGYSYIEYYINELSDNIAGLLGPTYTIQTNVSPADSGAVLAPNGVYDWELFAKGGYNAAYWYGLTNFGTAEYNEGSIAIMKAKPKPGYVFDHWEGGPVDGLTSTQVSFPAAANANITAHFKSIEQRSINVSISPEGAGGVFGEGEYLEGEVATLGAYSNNGYKFKRWIGGPIDGAVNHVVQFISQENLEITAEFESGNGGDVLIDDFNDRDTNTSLLSVSGVPKKWELTGALDFLEISPGNFAITHLLPNPQGIRNGGIEIENEDRSKPEKEFDIPDDATVIKFRVYNLENKSAMTEEYIRRWKNVGGVSAGYGTRPRDHWYNYLYWTRPFRFPNIEPMGSSFVEMPLSLLKNADMSRTINPAQNNLRTLDLYNFFGIWNVSIAVDDISFGRSGVDEATLPNLPPVANAGRDQVTKDVDRDGKEVVLLNGLKSYDGNAGLIKTWTWKENGAQIATGFAPSVELGVGEHTIELTITDEGGLSSTDTVNIQVLESTTPPPTLEGDVNGDGRVDILDLVIVARAFGSNPGDANWNANADLNKDDTVNIMDLITVARNFGRGA